MNYASVQEMMNLFPKGKTPVNLSLVRFTFVKEPLLSVHETYKTKKTFSTFSRDPSRSLNLFL